jgi:hypothetical protein
MSFFCASCTSTRNALFQELDAEVEGHNYGGAAQRIDEPGPSGELYGEKDGVLFYLDSGILYHAAGEPRKSIERFDEAEILIEENFTKSVTDAVSSFLLNDYQLEYAGEAYEDIYLNVFKAIDYLKLGSFDGAYVEMRRLEEKLNLLEDKYEALAQSINSSPEAKGALKAASTDFYNSALARYISVLLYRADRRRDSAVIELGRLKEAFSRQPALFDFPLPPELDGLLRRGEKAKINVIGFTGRSPIKRASTVRLTTGEGLILVTQEKEDAGGRMVLVNAAPIPFPVSAGFNFKCQLPQMKLRPSRIKRLVLFVDGAAAGELSLIEKMDKVAEETFKLAQSMIFFKTIVRTVTKGVTIKMAKNLADKRAKAAGGGWFSVLSLVGGVAADVAADLSEEADLRAARYFPGQAYVGEFLVEPGEHELALEFYDGAGRRVYREEIPRRNYTQEALNLVTACELQ